MDLNRYMKQGIGNITDTAARFYLHNAAGLRFIKRMAQNLHTGTKRREGYEQEGIHIPPFLIASIASDCNLHCAGCYARAGGACGSCNDQVEAPNHIEGQGQAADLTVAEWRRIFHEAAELGVSFILLAGGEPLLREDVIRLAAEFPSIIFPVFTNGTMLEGQYLGLFEQHRNLIPVLSIEGDEAQTDARRGAGVAKQVQAVMEQLQERGILYGASVTVTTENMHEVMEQGYVEGLKQQGCGIVFYIEYVPAEENTEHLMLSDEELADLQLQLAVLKQEKRNKGIILLSFPGDEQYMGGCLAAGRGFFHISPTGGAEPCPFSPFSEQNMKEHSLKEVLKSRFFEEIRKISSDEAEYHQGGCTLFQHRDRVMGICDNTKASKR